MSARSMLLFCAIAVVVAGCRKETPPVPKPKNAPAAAASSNAAPESAKDLNLVIPLMKDAVAKCTPEKKEFAAKEAVRLTLDLNESPEGLRVGARIVGEDDKELAMQNVAANGQKRVTVTVVAPQKKGTYTLEGYWGGNRVCSEAIVVR